ncbi:MAG TPA: peptide chain release factor N(5)-glutamine methyltransferase [Syntrophomonas sp.]|nr:peptide chain release factor N(5)-glutamine methyltransferase [Syntrophomonas sp.]HRW11647.1 peptide chain release factor N(5)-glutamine methyltransferase [Syntrophomonas sp.]
MQAVWRIKDLLQWTTRYFLDRGIKESRLEAEILLAHVLKKDRVYLYANYEAPVNPDERALYKEYIKRRTKSEPIAYITGHKEFMSLDLIVTPDVLIPRPETELLVETAIKAAKDLEKVRIVDVGTGSGAIAVSLAYYLKQAQVSATDISLPALKVACQNAERHQVSIDFHAGSLLESFFTRPAGEPSAHFDILVANLPYVPETDRDSLEPQVRDFEPHLALFAGEDGLDLYRQLLPQARRVLPEGAIMLLEIDPRQAGLIASSMQGFSEIRIIHDAAGRARMVQARRSQ